MGSAGRGQQQTTAGAGLNNINSGQGILGNATNVANSEVNTSGGLSPLVGKQLANEEGQIGKAYQGATQAALRGNTQRGMGVGPSGLTASVENTGINNAGAARTGAIGNAFGTQNTLNNTAYAQPISALGAENGAIGASTGANTALNQMPTTAGQVFSGLQSLGGTAMMAFCPAEGSMYLLPNSTEKAVETLSVGDFIAGIDDEPQMVEDVQSVFTPILLVVTENGYKNRVAGTHAFALPRGGFTVAAKSLGKVIKTVNGPSPVVSVEPYGSAWVFNIITDGSHTYRADGIWAYGVGEAERHVGMNQWAAISKKLIEKELVAA